MELTRQETTSAAAATAAERFFALARPARSSGWATRPGLVLGRIVAQLVNEACFAVGEGVGSPADVDAGWCWGSTTRAARSNGAI